MKHESSREGYEEFGQNLTLGLHKCLFVVLKEIIIIVICMLLYLQLHIYILMIAKLSLLETKII